MKKKFIPGLTYIPVSGKIYDNNEVNNLIKAARDGWWTEGRFAKQFEKDFYKYLGVRYISLVNSGSSANLVALASLTSSLLKDKRLQPGDEFITTSVAFPTTVNPGILYGLKPVFVDVDLDSLNANLDQVEKAITKKTKLIMVAHTLGKPYNMDRLMKIVKKNHLWLIEDCCDALGSKWDNKYLGTFGDLATFSFYPAHQITMGEGGAVVTSNPLLHRLVRRFRDWGRDCWCDTGHDDTCHKRFKWKMGDLPYGYDHKYIYSEIGFNLKLTDFQAAIGVAQLVKLPHFIKKRKENYNRLFDFFSNYKKWFILMKEEEKEDCSYFGFPIVVREVAPFTRNELTQYLEKNKIGTRNVFSGNLLKHPAYKNLKHRSLYKLINTDKVMNNAFWIGVFPGIDKGKINYVKEVVTNFIVQYK